MTAQEALADILRMQSETFGFAQHPYQRAKRVAGTGVLDHGDLWHCKNIRKYGATLTCPYRCTSQCCFKIRYQYKKDRPSVYTLGEHTHENEIRKRGLKLEKASRLVEAVEVKGHPWFVGVQFHPEYRSTVANPHPLIVKFVEMAMQQGKKVSG